MTKNYPLHAFTEIKYNMGDETLNNRELGLKTKPIK